VTQGEKVPPPPETAAKGLIIIAPEHIAAGENYPWLSGPGDKLL
jgi:hypothetical protein